MGVGAVAGLAVRQAFGGRRQVGQMLVQGAGALHVHGLAAHADAQGGQSAGFGEGEDGQVEILAVFGG